MQMAACYDMIKATHDWEGDEGFIADGVICPEIYAQQSLRILCVLGESWGYEHCGMTPIENQPSKDILGLGNPKAQTPRKLGTFLWLLQKSLQQGHMIEWDEFPSLFTINPEHTAQLQSTLSKIAWINLKKASRPNSTRMVNAEVTEHATRNEAIVRKQIQAIKPHLMIIGSSVVFLSMHRMGLLPKGIEVQRVWQLQEPGNAAAALEVTHPASWWGYQKLYDRFTGFYQSFMNSKLISVYKRSTQ